MLRDLILPRLIGQHFASMDDVEVFLRRCDGETPAWVAAGSPQTAAWCAVDLALLDAFGRAFGARAPSGESGDLPRSFRYSGVLSADKGLRLVKSALKQRLYGVRQVKLKVDDVSDAEAVRLLRRVFGRSLDVRVDANMAWDTPQAVDAMLAMSRYGVRSFEQPIAANDIEGMAQLVSATQLDVMADESLSTAASLDEVGAGESLHRRQRAHLEVRRTDRCVQSRARGAGAGPDAAARLPGRRILAAVGGAVASGSRPCNRSPTRRAVSGVSCCAKTRRRLFCSLVTVADRRRRRKAPGWE